MPAVNGENLPARVACSSPLSSSAIILTHQQLLLLSCRCQRIMRATTAIFRLPACPPWFHRGRQGSPPIIASSVGHISMPLLIHNPQRPSPPVCTQTIELSISHMRWSLAGEINRQLQPPAPASRCGITLAMRFMLMPATSWCADHHRPAIVISCLASAFGSLFSFSFQLKGKPSVQGAASGW